MSPYDRERFDPRPRHGDDYGILLKSILTPSFNKFLFQMLIPAHMVIDRLLVHSSQLRTPLSNLRHRGERLLTLVLWTTLLH